MNTIGIIGAMEDEIRQLRDKLEAPEVKRKASMEFHGKIFSCYGAGKH